MNGFDFQVSELFNDEYFEILRSTSAFRSLKKIPYTISRFRNRRSILKSDLADLSIIEQQLFPYVPFSIERRYLPQRYLLEFDDAIYLTHPAKMPRMIEHAAGIIAGNETLAEYARRRNRNVHVVPTVLDTERFKPVFRPTHSKVVVGWSGLEYNFPYLQMISPVFRWIAQRSNVEICILAVSAPKDFDFPFRFEKWNPRMEVDQLNQFDIGLMPLRSDEWCKGKCGLKLLQYMSLEIPSIASAVGVNETILKNGVNGFLASNINDWEKHLISLIENPDLRMSIGKAARTTVVQEYSTEVWFPKLAEIYRSYGIRAR